MKYKKIKIFKKNNSPINIKKIKNHIFATCIKIKIWMINQLMDQLIFRNRSKTKYFRKNYKI